MYNIIKVDYLHNIFSVIVLMTISEYDDKMFVFCRYDPLCAVLIFRNY